MTDRVLGDDHIDLLISAALRWRVLGSTTTAAFSSHASTTHPGTAHPSLESRILTLTATQAGRAIRGQNGRAILRLLQQGLIPMSERITLSGYDHTPVETIDALEVLKAVQAARELCQASPDWDSSPARRLLEVLADSATCRLPGYAVAPWHWTRPERHRLGVVGICTAGDGHPDIAQVHWVDVEQAGEVWDQAAIVLVSVPAALKLPVGLASRPGVHILTGDPIGNDQVWAAVTVVGQQALILSWPHCQAWLAELIASLPQPVASQ